MAGTIENRTQFLDTLLKKRGGVELPFEPYTFISDLPQTHLADLSSNELLKLAKEQARRVSANLVETTSSEMNEIIYGLIEKSVPEIEAISRGQYIFRGNKIDYFRVRGQIVNDEPMMNLAKEFLTHKEVDFSNFCTENFMSESTLRKYIRNANELLIPLGIRINICQGNVRIVGNEASIRYCLVSLFWRYFRGIYWPFKEVERETLDRFISSLTSVSEGISYGKRLQLTYYWAV